jgi:hypothetical protein
MTFRTRRRGVSPKLSAARSILFWIEEGVGKFVADRVARKLADPATNFREVSDLRNWKRTHKFLVGVSRQLQQIHGMTRPRLERATPVSELSEREVQGLKKLLKKSGLAPKYHRRRR